MQPLGVNQQLKASKKECLGSSENPGPREKVEGFLGEAPPHIWVWKDVQVGKGGGGTTDGETACAKVKSGSRLLYVPGQEEERGRKDKAGTTPVTRAANVSRAPAM